MVLKEYQSMAYQFLVGSEISKVVFIFFSFFFFNRTIVNWKNIKFQVQKYQVSHGTGPKANGDNDNLSPHLLPTQIIVKCLVRNNKKMTVIKQCLHVCSLGNGWPTVQKWIFDGICLNPIRIQQRPTRAIFRQSGEGWESMSAVC